jgi:putative tryptophan/tyrosine transport system substrate-binding protein
MPIHEENWSMRCQIGFKAMRVACAAVLLFGLLEPSRAQPAPRTIAISQIIENADLDGVRRGAVDALRQAGYTDLKIVYENAQGDVGTAVQIAKRFAGLSPDLILVIGTPTAQALMRSVTNIPIVFGGIGDPVGAGLVATLDHPGGNLTGTRSFTPVEPQLDLIRKILPAAKRIGILNNPAEANSRAAVDAFVKAGSALGYVFVRETVTASSEAYTAASNLVGKVDAIFVPTDSTVVSALESVVKVSLSGKVPLFTAETGGVNRGALASVGLDWTEIGNDTGRIAARVLNGEKPGDIPVAAASRVSLRINAKTAKSLGIELPAEVVAQADQIVH